LAPMVQGGAKVALAGGWRDGSVGPTWESVRHFVC
jgi:hypothetical protein